MLGLGFALCAPAHPEARDQQSTKGIRVSILNCGNAFPLRFGSVLRLALIAGAVLSAVSPSFAAERPDFGPNVLVFDPSMPSASMQQQIDRIYAIEQHAEFGSDRYAILFKPGDYKVDIPVGFYTQVLGLGASPDGVRISGNVHADASLPRNNATCTFWRAAEGLSITPTTGTMQWAVSQAVPFRRMHVRGNLVLHQNRGWASGGWMSDSLVEGNVDAGTQQQWISRNSEWTSWSGSNWNMVFVGVNHPPSGEWPTQPYTKVGLTPIVREKPFLQVDGAGKYSVRVPALVSNSTGVSWHSGVTPGRSISISRFYIAHPGADTAATLNAALTKGQDLLLTPGNYDLAEPLHVTRPDTVVLGLGFATLHPVNGTPAILTADADGIILAGMLIDAGEKESPVLLQIGPAGSHKSHSKNPVSLHDIFFRVGGAGSGRAGINIEINSNDTIIDHTWIWRADHGKGTGWESNPSRNGLVVNGANVTAYGLFVEHHQQYQVLWNGNGGRTYFYQSEIPYDPPTQASYSSAPGVNGWASYKVADSVTTHQAFGLGVYSVFRHPDVVLTRAIEVPDQPGMHFEHMITVALDSKGEISNVIDDKGGPALPRKPGRSRTTPMVTVFP
jgi:hypothetical protein